jgi:phosphatidylglycerol---prolipoprotein diacylglyceryl transferase
LTIPYHPQLFGININIHLVLEYLAFFVGARFYFASRKKAIDHISNSRRMSIILGAIAGAFVGSRLIGFLENPLPIKDIASVFRSLQDKSIMGGLFGGLLGVELAKKIINEKQSSGDLFTFPILLGIMIGRVGCFLTGTNEFTYGLPTKAFTGMDLGDAVLRHPIALYEIAFLGLLWFILAKIKPVLAQRQGHLFKVFMLMYFGFRFCIEFIKPNFYELFGLSAIQYLCISCWLYYLSTSKILKYAY